MRRTKQQKLLYYTRPHFYQKVLSQLQEVEEKICWLLAKSEHFRNCDMCLMFYYWSHIDHWNSYQNPTTLHKLTSAETITRCRRYIQNTLHLWVPTDPEVVEKRSIKESAIKEWFIARNKIGLAEV